MTEARAPRALRMKNVISALSMACWPALSADAAKSKKEVERLQNCAIFQRDSRYPGQSSDDPSQ